MKSHNGIRSIPPEKYQDIIDMLNSGMSANEICKTLKISNTPVHKVRKLMGYKYPHEV